MKGNGSIVSTDIVDVMPAMIAVLMLAVAFLTFTYDRLFNTFLRLANVSVPPHSEILWLALIVTLSGLLLSFFRIWPSEVIRAATYLAWLLYLPSVLYYSGIDVFRILSISANFGIFSSDLSFTVIAMTGILLACLSLAGRALSRLKKERESYLSRGADRPEVRRALFHNAMFEIRLVVVAGAVTAIFAYMAQYAGQNMQAILKSVGFSYLLAGLAAIVLLVLVLILFLWPHKNGEKG